MLTLTGTASVAAYEDTIRTVTYENISENPSADPRTVQFQVTDSTGALSAPTTRDVYVTPVNDAPVATTTAGSASYTGADPPTTIDSGLTAWSKESRSTSSVTGGAESGGSWATGGGATPRFGAKSALILARIPLTGAPPRSPPYALGLTTNKPHRYAVSEDGRQENRG